MGSLPSQKQDFSAWYLEVVKQADLADYSQVKGCMIIKPYGYAIWELIQKDLDARIKAAGVQNVYFPLFIPENLLTREKEHLEGFSPECAVVTHGGGKELTEPLIVRPTSETIMYDTFSKWIQSHRDLPLMINQWANVVRWEMRTRPFLRTTEFLWQEGHTAHATREEAEQEVYRALHMYVDFEREAMALPVLSGKKSQKETFAGAEYTTTTEALARDGKSIQAATSHLLGQTFSRSFGIQFQNHEGNLEYAWQTSWGMSTRIIGTMIVCHGDDKGLRLPPRLAPYQVVVLPIFKGNEEKEKIMTEAFQIQKELSALGIRIHIDQREHLTPGWKFNDWEVKGVPLRLEIGPRDLEKQQVVLARRDTGAKQMTPRAELTTAVSELLNAIHENMYQEAQAYLESHIASAQTLEEMVKLLDAQGGFVKLPWAGDANDERVLQEETKATVRILEVDALEKPLPCFKTGKSTKTLAYFARAY